MGVGGGSPCWFSSKRLKGLKKKSGKSWRDVVWKVEVVRQSELN